MKPLVAAAAFVLLPLAPTPAFPPPKLIPVTPELKCDTGTVKALDADKSELVLGTDAGSFHLSIGAGVKVAGKDGKALPSVRDLRAGQNVRAYYVVSDGAHAREIDVVP
jgi:hypothetical protein